MVIEILLLRHFTWRHPPPTTDIEHCVSADTCDQSEGLSLRVEVLFLHLIWVLLFRFSWDVV